MISMNKNSKTCLRWEGLGCCYQIRSRTRAHQQDLSGKIELFLVLAVYIQPYYRMHFKQ